MGVRGLVVALLSCVCAIFLSVSAEASAVRDRSAPAEPAPREFTAWIISDIHFLAESLHDDGVLYQRILQRGDNKNIAAVDSLLDAFCWSASIGAGADRRPDCVIVTGDLSFCGELESHLVLAKRFSELAAAGIPVYVLPGNHDLNNPEACSYVGARAIAAEAVDSAEFSRIYADCGFASAVSRDAESLSYLAEPMPGVRLLMLDTTCADDNLARGYSEVCGRLKGSTRAWIRECAERAAADGARLVVAMHHSLMDHNELINEGYTIDDCGDIAELFSDIGVRFVLSGHTHIQDIAQEDLSSGAIYDITTGALSVYPHDYGILRLELGDRLGSSEYRCARIDVPAWARATGSADPLALNFDSEAEAFFRAHSSRMMGSMLAQACSADPLPSADSSRIIELLVDMNECFFCGQDCAACLAADPIGSSLLAKLPDCFLAAYARSIAHDPSPDGELYLP